jgi:hypothetical protein
MTATKQETATIPVGRYNRTTRFSASRRLKATQENISDTNQTAQTRSGSKSIPVSRLPIRSNQIYQNPSDFAAENFPEVVHDACKRARAELEERITALEMLNDRLQAEVDEHRRVNIELLKTCQGLRYAQMSPK